jgi:uncharacterized protein YutE (UPF0331/DUF86 family)
VVDQERVLRLLNRMERDVAVLADLAGRGDLLGDPVLLGSVKYYFVTAIEGCARVAHHIAAAEGWPVSDSNGEAVRQLGRREIVERDLADGLAAAVGFRTILVHEYVEVDDDLTVAHLDELDDFRQFTRQVAAWLLG